MEDILSEQSWREKQLRSAGRLPLWWGRLRCERMGSGEIGDLPVSTECFGQNFGDCRWSRRISPRGRSCRGSEFEL